MLLIYPVLQSHEWWMLPLLWYAAVIFYCQRRQDAVWSCLTGFLSCLSTVMTKVRGCYENMYFWAVSRSFTPHCIVRGYNRCMNLMLLALLLLCLSVCVRVSDWEGFCAEQTSVSLAEPGFVTLFWNGNDNEGGITCSYTDQLAGKKKIMWCKNQQSWNVESCYHTSGVTHLADVFGSENPHLCTLYLFLPNGVLFPVFFCFVLHVSCVVLSVLLAVVLTETLWMRY